MPQPVTQAQLRERVRRIVDHESGAAATRLADAEIDAYNDFHLAELYDLMTQAWGSEWASQEGSFSTVAGQYFYPIDETSHAVRNLLSVEVLFGSVLYPMTPMGPRGEAPRDMSRTVWRAGSRITYRFMGLGADTAASANVADDHPGGTRPAGLYFHPVPAGVYTVWFTYVPQYVGMSSFYGTLAVTTADDVHRWSWFAVYKTAADIMLKNEEDPGPYLAKAAELESRIRSYRHNRDAGGAERSKDMRRARRAGVFR